MATASERRRRQLAKSQARALQVAAERAGGEGAKLVELKPKRAEAQRKPGLRFLLSKNKISRAMCEAGERYATGVRVASCVDSTSVRSCLAAIESGGGGGLGAMPRVRSAEELEGAEWIAEYRRQTHFIRTRLFDDVELMGVLDSIAVLQLTPREIIERMHGDKDEPVLTAAQVQRHTETLEAVAWTVLKLLISILRDYDNPPQVSGAPLPCAA